MRDLEKPKVLCVDDDDVILYHLFTILDGDFQVQCAQDGKEGLQMLAGGGVDWVILDYMLPDMTGGSFVITAEKLGYHPNYLLLSSLELGPVGETGLVNLGVRGSLVKPVDPKRLCRMMSRPSPRANRDGLVDVGDYIAWMHSVEDRGIKETRGMR